MEQKTWIPSQTQKGIRIDSFIAAECGITRSAAAHLADKGLVEVGGKAVPKRYVLRAGDVVCVTLPDPEPTDVKAENIPLDIVYEDADLLVVNKPKGMVVHPAAGHTDGTLVNALLWHCGDSLSGINGVMRPGIVHRIDKDTSGLLMVAKNDTAHHRLAAQIKDHQFTRRYEAVVCGHLKEAAGTVDAPIGRHPKERKKMAVTEKGSRNAVTHYRVLRSYAGYDRVELELETGRTHQIRVHMALLGHPVAGDTVYGGRAIAAFEGQCLHAKLLGFVHPTTDAYMEFEAPLPPYFEAFIKELEGSE